MKWKKDNENRLKISQPIFLGSHYAENYRDMLADPVQSYKAMGCNMSLETHLT